MKKYDPKKFYGLMSLLLLCSFQVFGQQNNTLRGKMLFMSSGKKVAVGVKVSGSILGMKTDNENATATYTDSKGNFTLEFPAERDGHSVKLNIGETDADSKSIEVVNTTELDICRIPANATDVFEVIVCRKGQRDDKAKHYYNIIKSSTDIALAKKREEINQLLNEGEKNYEKIDALSKRLLVLVKRTDSLHIYKEAYRIASINKDNASERVLKYIQALDEGKNIEEALEFLSLKEAAKEARDGINGFEASIAELKLCASAAVAILDYENAIACYNSIISLAEKMDINPATIEKYVDAVNVIRQASEMFDKVLNSDITPNEENNLTIK